MANKKLIIETEVKTDGLDKASQKLGELKKISGAIKIQYDIDGRPLDVVVDKTLNLKTQVTQLTKALRSVKEGSDEFKILSSTLSDTQDKLAQSNAKSRDLLASFQLIPGPVGEFASKLNGAIGLLKTFSSFSLKDISFQFKETVNDITDIIDGFFGLEKATSDTTAEIENKTAALDDNTNAEQENVAATEDGTAATNAGTAANLKQTEAIKEQDKVKRTSLSVSEKRLEAQIKANEATKAEIEFLSNAKNAEQAITDVMKAGNVTRGQATFAYEQMMKKLEQDLELGEQKRRQLERNIVYENNAIEAQKKQGQTIANLTEAQREQFKEISRIADADERLAKQNEFLTEVEKQNTSATQTNTVAKEANTVVTQVYTKATQLAAFATRALDLALKSIGIGIVIALVTKAAEALYDLGKSFFSATQEEKDFAEALKKNNETRETAINTTLEVKKAFELAATGVITKKKALDIYNEKLGNTIGQAKTYNEAEKLFNDNTAAYIESVSLRAEAQELFALAAQRAANALNPDEIEPSFWQNVGNSLMSGGAAAGFLQRTLNTTLENGLKFQEQANTLRTKGNELLGKALALENKFKPKEEKKTGGAGNKEVEESEKANALLLKLQQENTVARIAEERKKQDAQLKIDKENEEREVNALKLSKKNEGLRGQILEEIRKKYGLKVIELNKKRQEEDNKIFEEDQKKLREYQSKIFEIMNSGDENELNRAKAARTKKFEDDKAAIQADVNFQKQSLEEKIRILLAIEKAYKQDIQKLDDDDAAKNREKALKKLDDELKFLQIRGEAVRKGTIAYFNNLREISKKSEQRELKDLEDRAIKEKMTTEQVEAEKLAIKKKYANERKQIDQQELEQYLAYATQTLSAVSNVFSQIGQVNALEQQVAQENLTKSYIEANNQAKATITNQEELEKKLAENKKKFAKDEDSLKKAAFEQNKKIQIAQAVIATLQSAVQAFSSLAGIPVVGPALGAAAAAAALVFGYKQVALIKKTTYQSPLDLAESESLPQAKPNLANYGRNYEKGGLIGGRRHAEGGTIIEAEKGEAIMTRGAVATFGPLLSLMNQAGGGTSFNSNLLTTRQDAPAVAVPAQQQQTPVFKTYVVSQELTTEAQRQARLKNLSVI